MQDNPRWEATARFWRQTGLLFVVNVIALFCGMFALIAWTFQDNWIAASFPAALAFCLAVWQCWLMFRYVVFIAFRPSPSSPPRPVTLPLWFRYVSLEEQLRWASRSPRVVGAWVGGVLLAGALVSDVGYRDVVPQHTGVPPTLSGRVSAAASGLPLTESRYYFLDRFIDTEFLWRIEVYPTQLRGLLKRLSLTPAQPGTLGAGFWQQLPVWWQSPTGEMEEFTTGDFTVNAVNGEGWHAGAVYDVTHATLYLWGKDNF